MLIKGVNNTGNTKTFRHIRDLNRGPQIISCHQALYQHSHETLMLDMVFKHYIHTTHTTRTSM